MWREPLPLPRANGTRHYLKLMIISGDDLNFTDENGRNLLHWVALHGHVEEITPLIGKGGYQ